MVVVIIGMLVCIGLALFVIALVALPAHRSGETVFTPRGEQPVAQPQVDADAPHAEQAATTDGTTPPATRTTRSTPETSDSTAATSEAVAPPKSSKRSKLARFAKPGAAALHPDATDGSTASTTDDQAELATSGGSARG